MPKGIFDYYSGLPVKPQCQTFYLETENDVLLLKEMKLPIIGYGEVLRTYKIPLENIVMLGLDTEKQLKDKNAIARGIIGGALAGSDGAAVGAMSGVGQKTENVMLLGIDYLSAKEPGVLKTIRFEITLLAQQNCMKDVKKIKKVWEGVPKSELVHAYLNQGMGEDGTIEL